MLWFKIFLMVWLTFECIEVIAKAGGWEPKRHSPALYAIDTVIYTLLIIAIWFWL